MRPLLLLLMALTLLAQEHRFKITQHFTIAREAVRLWIPLPMQNAYQHFDELGVGLSRRQMRGCERRLRHPRSTAARNATWNIKGGFPPIRAT